MGRLTYDELAGPLTEHEVKEVEGFLSKLCTLSLPAIFTLAALRGSLEYGTLKDLCIIRVNDKVQAAISLIQAPYGTYVEVCTSKLSLDKKLMRDIVSLVRSFVREYSADNICVDNVYLSDMLIMEFKVKNYILLLPYVLDIDELDRRSEEEDVNTSDISDIKVSLIGEDYLDKVRELLSSWSSTHVKLAEYTLKFGIAIGALCDNKLVGYLSTYVTLPECWVLASLFVHPDCRGRGIGRMLIRKIIELAVGKTKRLIATVEPVRAAARRLYLKLGFKPKYRTQHAIELSAE